VAAPQGVGGLVLAPLADTDPRTIGPFRMTGRLGAGGMGVVYLGFGPDDSPVAVKVPSPELAGDPRFRARFRREVDAVKMISSHSVATVVAADTDAESPWLATEYVQGATLLDAVTGRGPVAPRLAVAFAAGLADGLVAMHAVGVVHRDLKPANVVLAWDGPKIIDFGVALTTQSVLGDSSTDSDPDLTQAKTQFGQRLGTVVWMAPEQLRGDTVGPPADVFAWAACVTYATTGRSPFRSDSLVDTLGRIQHGEPELTGVPDDLVDLLRAALAKDPRARPSATALVSGLVHREVRTPRESDRAVETVLTGWADQPPTPAAGRPLPPPAIGPGTAPTPMAKAGPLAPPAGTGRGPGPARGDQPTDRQAPVAETLNLPPARARQGQPRPAGRGQPAGGDRYRDSGRQGPPTGGWAGGEPPHGQGGGWTEESDLPTYIRPETGPLARGGAYGAAAGWAGERDRPDGAGRPGRSTRMKAMLAALTVVVLGVAVALGLLLTNSGGSDDPGQPVSQTSPVSSTAPVSASPTPSPSVSASASDEPTSQPPSTRRTTRPPTRTTSRPPTTTTTPPHVTTTPPTVTTPPAVTTPPVTTPPGNSTPTNPVTAPPS